VEREEKGKIRVKGKEFPQATLNRLPYYLRSLYVLDDEGFEVVSSSDIAELVGSTSAQVRKDLSYLGEFGHRGVGYRVKYLIEILEKFLGVSRRRRVILVGVGRLGEALLNSKNIRARGFDFVAAFDIDPEKIGKTISGVPVYDFRKIYEIIGDEKIDIGIITTSPDAAQEVADKLVEVGVKGILNFVPVPVKVPANVPLRTVCIAAEMQLLAFQIKHLKPRIKKRARVLY
jgi:redox-sensing transcriptional repressor